MTCKRKFPSRTTGIKEPIPKPSKEELAYWEKILHDHRLGVGRGRRNWMDYGHEYFDSGSNEEDYSEESEP